MKFFMTMNMPSNQGRAVHQMIVELPGVQGLGELAHVLAQNVFITVDEYYYIRDETGQTSGTYRMRGPIIINTEYIGKVREVAGVFRHDDA
jgi:hypothetical protein